MSKIYEKWRDLNINPFNIEFKNIKLKEIVSYPPAGNDVIECECYLDNTLLNVFIKIERSKMSNFATEEKHLKILHNKGYCSEVPKIYENGSVNDKIYIVLEKLEGDRLSDIFNNGISESLKHKYIINYGKKLAQIHCIPCKEFEDAKQRVINSCPSKDSYIEYDDFITPYIKYLEDNKPSVNYETFIHGDFHYANILWKEGKVTGILDFEYSGKGFKEQDIAWACVLRPAQSFMDNIKDTKYFLKGYLELGTFDKEKLRWCLINAYCHFYLMNMEDESYKNKLKKLMLEIKKEKFVFSDYISSAY